MLGAIQFEEFEGLTKMPQDVATAWSGAENGWTGSSFKPIKFLGNPAVFLLKTEESIALKKLSSNSLGAVDL